MAKEFDNRDAFNLRLLPKKLSTKARFESSYMPEPMSGCWLWLGGVWGNGYGRFKMDGRVAKSSRAAWMLYKGPIPNGMCVLHSCDNRACVNPNHLFLGTQLDNVSDMVMKRRQSCGERHSGCIKNPARGVKNSSNKLSEDDVKRIYSSTLSQRAIASTYNVSQTMVWSIKHGKAWSWLTTE